MSEQNLIPADDDAEGHGFKHNVNETVDTDDDDDDTEGHRPHA